MRGASLKLWAQELTNHMWWSARKADGNGDLCREYVFSSLLHVINIHEWNIGDKIVDLLQGQGANIAVIGSDFKNFTFQLIDQCHHTPDASNRIPITANSKTYEVLLKIYSGNAFFDEISKVSPEFATSWLEGYHGLVAYKYRSKQVFYNMTSFVARTRLSILHHNHNILDERTGKRKIVSKNSKPAKHRGGLIVEHNRKTPPDFSWKKTLISNTINQITIDKLPPSANEVITTMPDYNFDYYDTDEEWNAIFDDIDDYPLY